MIKNTYPGKFIVFEGLDGSGKSTQARLLSDYLATKSGGVILTKEPTRESEAGKKLRELSVEELKNDKLNIQQLFANDREWHLENVILPALINGKNVVCDRYFFSSFAYGSADGLKLQDLEKINDNFIVPDITFIIKVSPEICVKRMAGRDEKDHIIIFKKKEFLEKVENSFEALPSRFENVYMIEGERPIPEIFEDIKKIITNKLSL